MRAMITLMAAAVALGACAQDTSLPTLPYQWEQRQAKIEREFNARQTACLTIEDESERRALECPQPRPGADK